MTVYEPLEYDLPQSGSVLAFVLSTRRNNNEATTNDAERLVAAAAAAAVATDDGVDCWYPAVAPRCQQDRSKAGCRR